MKGLQIEPVFKEAIIITLAFADDVKILCDLSAIKRQ